MLLLATCIRAQSIRGKVTDNKKEPIVNASVSISQNGIGKGGTITDFDGRFAIDSLEPGYYDVTITYLGYKIYTFSKLLVSPGTVTGMNAVLTEVPGCGLIGCPVYYYSYPLVDKYKTSFKVHSWQIRGANR